MAVLRICVAVAFAALSVSAAPTGDAFADCHNITGTCFNHGFVCANGQVVEHSKRCDGFEDCHDATDEFMCHHELKDPLHLQSDDRRAELQATCVHCNCAANTMVIDHGNSWFNFAKMSPVDYYGLGTGAPSAYGGQPCNPQCVKRLRMTFYRKTGVCRGYLCCARQNECLACENSGVCFNKGNPSWHARCYIP